MRDLLKYYNSCYQADNNSLIISNFFGSSVENRISIEKEELIYGKLPYYPIPNKKAEQINKTLSLYSKEKELIYCSLFIIGETNSFNNRTTKMCSPLLVYSAEVFFDDDVYYLKIDRENGKINYALLSRIRGDIDDNSPFYDELFKLIHNQNIDESKMFQITNVLEKYLPDLKVNNLSFYPDLYDKRKIDSIFEERKVNLDNKYSIVPSSGIGIIPKSINTRGIINELSEISNNNQFSSSLNNIFCKNDRTKKSREKIGRVPGILSNAQQKTLKNVNKFPISLIVGPPGTGKSYTISALAVEQMCKGKSILIASRTDEAVNVIADKIENQLGIKGIVIRGGRSSYLKDLKKYLQNILSGNYIKESGINSDKLNSELKRIDKEISNLERAFINRVEDELSWGKHFAENKSKIGFFSNLRKKFINWRNESLLSHVEIIKSLDIALDIQSRKTIDYIQKKYSEQITKTLNRDRESLNDLLKALKARSGVELEKRFKQADFQSILKTFPIWLVKMSDINKVLPLKKELFDIALIDEATQCDIASSLPILQRSKHTVFTGDPAQLRHVSFLSNTRMKNLALKYDLENTNEDLLDYRNNSILDIVTNNIKNQDQVTFLNEHFRSTPSIIRFSNNKYYNGNLRIMNERPNISYNEGIKLVQCEGERTQQGINKKEAEFIINKIKDIILNELSLNKSTCRSIGVLSPFRNQSDYISNLLVQNFSHIEIQKHKLQSSTAYGFQGDERDVMFLSFVLDNNSHATVFRHISKHDVFNVSITRAKSMQFVCHSLNMKNIKTDSILKEYIESIENKESNNILNKEKDEFIIDVVKELNASGIKTWEAFPVAGLKIDIIAQLNSETYGIDLIGYPGEYAEAFSLERYKILQRAGLKTYPLAYTYWTKDRNKCFNELMSLFAE